PSQRFGWPGNRHVGTSQPQFFRCTALGKNQPCLTPSSKWKSWCGQRDFPGGRCLERSSHSGVPNSTKIRSASSFFTLNWPPLSLCECECECGGIAVASAKPLFFLSWDHLSFAFLDCFSDNSRAILSCFSTPGW